MGMGRVGYLIAEGRGIVIEKRARVGVSKITIIIAIEHYTPTSTRHP